MNKGTDMTTSLPFRLASIRFSDGILDALADRPCSWRAGQSNTALHNIECFCVHHRNFGTFDLTHLLSPKRLN